MMRKILFMLDEAGQLGHMPALDQGLTLLRSYGVRMTFFFQSIGQLHETFRGKESLLLDNTEQIYFGVNSFETAERVSKMLGPATITVSGKNDGTSVSYQDGGGSRSGGGATKGYSSANDIKEQGRPLLMPDEVLRLPSDLAIAFLRDCPPILFRRAKYFEDSLKRGLPMSLRQMMWWTLFTAAVTGAMWAGFVGR